MKDNHGLLLVAAVAILAVVGLVTFTSSSNVGAYNICPEGYRLMETSGVGGQSAQVCMLNEAVGPQTRFPSWQESEDRRRRIITGTYY